MSELRSFPLILSLAALPLGACDGGGSTATPDDAATAEHEGHDADGEGAGEDEFAGREVVDNWLAEPGDVTVCPISGRKFEVDDKSGHMSYEGYEFVFCCSGECLDKVEANPGKYLDELVEEAGGPASDPDPDAGGTIDDT